jgi:hypothetical protein
VDDIRGMRLAPTDRIGCRALRVELGKEWGRYKGKPTAYIHPNSPPPRQDTQHMTAPCQNDPVASAVCTDVLLSQGHVP